MYEDDNLRVIFREGVNNNLLMITFGDLGFYAHEERFFAQGPIEKYQLNAIGFMAKSANWYPQKSVLKAIEVLRSTIKSFNLVICFGGSMGGYAAIKYSKVLNAHRVLAYVPQWSIKPADCSSSDGRYVEHYHSDLSDMSIKESDLIDDIYIVIDKKYELDVFHANKINSNNRCHLLNLTYSGHGATTILAGSESFIEIIK